MIRTRHEEMVAEQERVRRTARWVLSGLAALFLLAVTLGALSVLAQDASPAPEAVVVESVPLADDPARLAVTLLTAVQSGQWGLVVSVALVLVVALVRRFGRGLPKVGPLLDHPVVAWLLPTVASVGGALVTSLVAGAPVSIGLVLSAVVTGLGANALYVGGKKVAEAREAGAAAAAGVTSKAEAVEVLKGPQP